MFMCLFLLLIAKQRRNQLSARTALLATCAALHCRGRCRREAPAPDAIDTLCPWGQPPHAQIGCSQGGTGGCTQRGPHSTLRKGVFLPSKRLVSAFYDPFFPRALLRTSVPTETLTRRLLRTFLRSTSYEEPCKRLRILLRSVLLHDPLGVRPKATPQERSPKLRKFISTSFSEQFQLGSFLTHLRGKQAEVCANFWKFVQTP